ncbi:THUMP domain-containing protein 1-like [Babylonia areolata]|uniref:THUMP domain-containing protein 1-like n=1 Tax=Babylonia areolata TaxID=304850 RepID=UPI003FD521BC
MSEGGQKKRKSKAWYRKQAYHNKRMKTDQLPGHRLTVGLKGFIITCNDRERDAVKESYNILNEYADKLYGPESKEEANSSGDSDGEDIEAAIAREVQTLKEATAKGERRFQNSETGAKNCIFIKTTLDDPAGLAHAIFTDLRQSKLQKSRHALRLLPVVGTCKANVKDISELAKDVLQPFFTETKLEVTFAINFKARNNSGVGREMVISTLRETIENTFPSVLLRFTHVNPQITILVEVMRGVACIAVAKDFALFRKYNLVEVVRDRPAESSEKTAVTQNTTAENADKQEGQEVNETGGENSICEGGKQMYVAAEEAEKLPDSSLASGQEGVTAVPVSSEVQISGETSIEHVASECTADSVTDSGSGAAAVDESPPPNSATAVEPETEEAAARAVISDCEAPVPVETEPQGCDEVSGGSLQTDEGPQGVIPLSDESAVAAD